MTPLLSSCRAVLEVHADDVLVPLPGSDLPALTRREGYCPLLVAYTHEDKEAKGLRKMLAPQTPRPPVHFTALEMVGSDRAVLLLGPHGSGKTSFALDLALSLLGSHMALPGFSVTHLTRPVPRNDLGSIEPETWTGPAALPIYLPLSPSLGAADTLAGWLDAQAPGWADVDSGPLLLLLDNVENLGDLGPGILDELACLLAQHDTLRAVIFGESATCRRWPLPSGFTSYSLLPLLAAQRMAHAQRCGVQLGQPLPGQTMAHSAPALPALFAFSLAIAVHVDDDDALLDAWLALDVPDAAARRARCAHAFMVWGQGRRTTPAASAFLPRALAARHLAHLGTDAIAALFNANPVLWTPVVTLAAPYLTDRVAVAEALGLLPGKAAGWGSLIAARLLGPDGAAGAWDAVRPGVMAALRNPVLPAMFRDEIGRLLAEIGDPRDLLMLCEVPAGRMTMGSATHLNSVPVHLLKVARFRIGRYPVTNASYAAFVAATDRFWRSPERDDPTRRNVPATDLTWHDANAYCAWLTMQWRATGRIGASDVVRLPSEPEWEYASRAGQPDAGDATVYPWAGAWGADLANSTEAGFNGKTSVGLWPAGASLFGVEDMTGQVWEWTSTLWGPDMAKPSLPYPYDPADGREAVSAAPQLRRVLRGGCFSSDRVKACCTYRGSLEPDGFWRGNGFRIAVSAATAEPSPEP